MRHLAHRVRQRLSNIRSLTLVGIGFAMGTADLIPGVSGGTIAFIFGIYDELLQSIKLVTGKVLQLVLKGRVVQAVKLIPLTFLLPLGFGILLAIVSLSNFLTFLLENFPEFVWAFFFGLVLVSLRLVVKRVKNWSMLLVTLFIVFTAGSYWLVGRSPVATSESLFMYFLSGALAICAMILPGISGSFILVLLGKYEQVLHAVTSNNFSILIVFILGVVVGISIFARILTWVFAKYHDLAVVVLSGFMLGSLRKIWPWQEVVGGRFYNILPEFSWNNVLVLVVGVLGIVVMWKLGKLGVTQETKKDLRT